MRWNCISVVIRRSVLQGDYTIHMSRCGRATSKQANRNHPLVVAALHLSRSSFETLRRPPLIPLRRRIFFFFFFFFLRKRKGNHRREREGDILQAPFDKVKMHSTGSPLASLKEEEKATTIESNTSSSSWFVCVCWP